MLFSSLLFLTRFLPCVLIVYFLIPGRMHNAWRNLALFAFSLLFYAWGEPRYIWLMLFSTAVDYVNGGLAGYFAERGRTGAARIFVISSAVINLSLLAVFKYAGRYALPIGISFYTFQSMSYTIDVYRGRARAERNPVNFGAYISLFPQLVAGPIVRFADIAGQLRDRRADAAMIRDGAMRFICGLAKKVLLANRAGEIFQAAVGGTRSMAGAWLGILAYMFQIYFDFSGYSDMAIGLMGIFGFRIPENFNYPYETESITDFWRRWHISLGNWFKEYVYIPLGGSRGSRRRTFLNIFIVWLLTGLWHGATANFVLWGLYFCFFLIMEKTWLLRALERLPAAARHIYSLAVIYFGWLIFAWEDIPGKSGFIRSMAGLGPSGMMDADTLYLIISNAVFLGIFAIGCTSLPKRAWTLLRKKAGAWFLLPECVFALAAVALCIACLVNGSYNPFLYFRF